MLISLRRCAKSNIHSQRKGFKPNRGLNSEMSLRGVALTAPRHGNLQFCKEVVLGKKALSSQDFKIETSMQLKEIIKQIPPLDETAMQAAQARQDRLTKPRGSLG